MSDQLMADYPLELSGEAFEELVAQASRRIAEFLRSQPDRHSLEWDQLEHQIESVTEPIPETAGRPFDQLLEQLFRDVFPVAFNTTGPGYLAYIPGGGLPHAAVADLIAMTTNRYIGLTAAAPVAAQIEATVIRWLVDIAGLGPEAGGFLISGGSLANWAGLVAARESLAPDTFHQGTIYTSNQAHHSVTKAASLAGFRRQHIRSIQVDGCFRVSLDHLQQQLVEDRRAGRQPVAIVAHAGTTNTGAVDDLESIADLAAAERVWLHVDAAYGGFFLLTQRGRDVLRGIERADSMTLDPHKGMFLPYGTGCLLVRRRAELQRAFGGRGEYMPAAATTAGGDFCDISPELTRDFRALRLWLPLQMHGVAPFRRCLDEKLDLVAYATQQLRRIPGIEIVAEPQLSIVAFRLAWPGRCDHELNRLNQALLRAINASGTVFLSSTVLGDRTILRLCILSFRTHRDRIDCCLEEIRRGVEQLTGGSSLDTALA